MPEKVLLAQERKGLKSTQMHLAPSALSTFCVVVGLGGGKGRRNTRKYVLLGEDDTRSSCRVTDVHQSLDIRQIPTPAPLQHRGGIYETKKLY